MSGAQSKRQAARNEKVLQELVQGVPGNNLCADCHSRNPGKNAFLDSLFVLAVNLSGFLSTNNQPLKTAWASWSVRTESTPFLPARLAKFNRNAST